MKTTWTGRQARIATLARTVLALSVIASGCRDDGAQEAGSAREPATVRAAAVTYAVVTRPVVATGTFGPKDEIALSFKIGGVVQRVAVDAGATVHAGQLLASLDLREIDAALAKARTGAAKAERDRERAHALYRDSVATLSQLQDAESAAELAHADLEAARFNHAHAVIVAPVDGVILRRSAEPGENLGPGSPVLLLGSRARGAVLRVGLADRDVVRIAHGDRAEVRFAALPERTFRGRVTEIGAAAERGTGTYAVEVALEDAEALAAGMVGDVSVFPSVGVRTAVVPVEALLEADGDEATVFALSADGTRALRRQVKVAFLEGGRVAVAGLDDATSVITDGAAWLTDGQAVRVIP